jgi:hypothetical protein
MKPLEDDIEALRELDHWRVRAATLRNRGKKALRSDSISWAPTTALTLEDAAVLKALLVHSRSETDETNAAAARARRLEQIDAKAVFGSDVDQLPVLRAARAMYALVGSPDSDFSKSVMLFYYAVLREIYAADAPDWVLGGARAREGLKPIAFVTFECIRAVIGANR